MTAFRRWGEVVVRHPRVFCLGVLTLTLLLGMGAFRLRLSIREEDQLPQSHPYVQIYNRINELFGGGAAVVIGIIPRSGDVFTPATLAKVARMTARLEAMPELAGKGSVWSLAAPRVKRMASQGGDLDVRQLMPTVPTDAEGAARGRARHHRRDHGMGGNLAEHGDLRRHGDGREHRLRGGAGLPGARGLRVQALGVPGGLTAFMMVVSSLTAVTLVPALALVVRPRFLFRGAT